MILKNKSKNLLMSCKFYKFRISDLMFEPDPKKVRKKKIELGFIKSGTEG